MDSQSYVGSGIIDGIIMKYDRIHDNQVEWYKSEIKALTEENGGVTPKSLLHSSIFRLLNTKQLGREYVNNGSKDTENVKYYYGKVGEKDSGIFCAEENCGLLMQQRSLVQHRAFLRTRPFEQFLRRL